MMEPIPGAGSAVSQAIARNGEKVIVDSEGNRTIAASRRPDGSLRKEIKIRPGFIREEERERYITKGTEFRSRAEKLSHYPVGYMFSPENEPVIPVIAKKKKSKKKKEQLATAFNNDELEIEVETFTSSCEKKEPTNDDDTVKETSHDNNTIKTIHNETLTIEETKILSTAPEKRLRNLHKKFREISQLQEATISGKVLSDEQKLKLSRKQEIEKEIETLEKLIKNISLFK